MRREKVNAKMFNATSSRVLNYAVAPLSHCRIIYYHRRHARIQHCARRAGRGDGGLVTKLAVENNRKTLVIRVRETAWRKCVLVFLIMLIVEGHN